MESAGKVYAQNPDPETKLGNLETMDLSKLEVLQNRYKNIVSNRVLLSRLKDRGESARHTLAAVEAELTLRASGGNSRPPPLEDHQDSAAEVDKLAQRMAQMEWNSSQPPIGQRPELDSDDDPDPEDLPLAGDAPPVAAPGDSSCASRLAPGPTSPGAAGDRAGVRGGAAAAAATTRQLLPKSATSRREARFLTNRARPPGGGGGVPSPAVPGPARRTLLAQWADSALAAPERPHTHTRLLDMDESLQLLTEHSRITEEERAAQLAARYAAVTDIEGGQMELDGASEDDMEDGDTGPAVIIGPSELVS